MTGGTTCNDDTLVIVSGCSDQTLACTDNDGADTCKCDYSSPLDPPK